MNEKDAIWHQMRQQRIIPSTRMTELGKMQQSRSVVFQMLISIHKRNNAFFMFIRRTEQAHAPTIDSLSTVKGSQ